MPVRSDKKALKQFYTELGEQYPEEKEVYQTLRGMLRRTFVLGVISGWEGSLLDVGCNRGMYLDAYEGGRRFGADISLPALERARRNKPVHYIVADAENLTCFRRESFDHVLCTEVIEHCMEPSGIFQGISHVLKSGGVALVTSPNYRGVRPEWTPVGSLARYLHDTKKMESYYHSAYRPEELEGLAGGAGLEVIGSGTTEKEIKYASKVPAVFLLAGRGINRIFKSEAFERRNERFFQQFTIWIQKVSHRTGLESVLLRFVREGVRSYILMKKPG